MTHSCLLDCHAHVLPDTTLARLPGGSSPRYVTAERRVLGRMLEAQDVAGITHALMSDSFYMESAAEELPGWSTADRARLFNDGMAELVGRHPGRLFGIGCLDPFGGEPAVRELERMGSELGLVGALVNPSDGRRYLDDPAAEPMLEAAEQLGFPLFIHPSRDVVADEPSNEFVLGVSVTRPTQTTICAARLIYSGTLDRHPGLKLLLAHGGGMLPYVAGRLDATWSAYRPGRWQGVDLLERPPSTYLRRFYCDTNTWSTAALRLLVDSFGVDRLVFGTDQPPVWFPLQQSIAALDFLDLSEEDSATVRCGNAAHLFGLEL